MPKEIAQSTSKAQELETLRSELTKAKAEHDEIWNRSSLQRSYSQEARMDHLSWSVLPKLRKQIEALQRDIEIEAPTPLLKLNPKSLSRSKEKQRSRSTQDLSG